MTLFSGVFAARLAAAFVAVALAAPSASAQQEPGEAQIHISVTGEDGKAVTVLKQDITITEDGQAREVLRLEQATEPPHIALLVDDSQAAQSAIAEMRRALREFISTVLEKDPRSQIALISFGERPTLLVDYTSSRELLERGVSRIFARPGSGAYMLEAIVSATRGMAKRNLPRPHIVIVGTEGIEFSNDSHTRVLEGLADSGAAMWALTLTSGPRAGETEATRQRPIALGKGTADSGGRQYQVLANTAIGVRLAAVANHIFNQYVVTFGRPEALMPPKDIKVTVSLAGAEVLAPVTAPPTRTTGDKQ